MKHKIGFNRLGRKASHREAMLRNMVTSLFKYERITTTKAKALAVRQNAEKMITRAKLDTVHNRRMVGRRIKDQEILAKLFTVIGPRFETRAGGYTRILKLGKRPGDASEMVILELVERTGEETESKGSKTAKKAEKKPVKKAEKSEKTAKAEKPAKVEKTEKAAKVEQKSEEPAKAEAPVVTEKTQQTEVQQTETAEASDKAAE